jgi:hypothetical protein
VVKDVSKLEAKFRSLRNDARIKQQSPFTANFSTADLGIGCGWNGALLCAGVGVWGDGAE